VAELEDALARVSTMVSEPPRAVPGHGDRRDERLAAIEESLSGIGGPSRT